MNIYQGDLRKANALTRQGAYLEAIRIYKRMQLVDSPLRSTIDFNIRLCELRITRANKKGEPLYSSDRIPIPSPTQNEDSDKKYDQNSHESCSLDKEIIDAKASAIDQQLFDGSSYLQENKDISSKEVDPYIHYMTTGWKERRSGHSRVYDFNKYLEIHRDVARLGINPVLHYLANGRSEGRRLFYTQKHLDKININREVIVSGVVERYRQRKICSAAIVIVNLEPWAKIENPEKVYVNYDYIVVGLPPQKTDTDSIWSYRPIRYHIDNLLKLESFATINMAQQLSDYRQVVWVSSKEYLDSREFGAALSQSETGDQKITVAGSAIKTAEVPKINEVMLFLSSIGINLENSSKISLLAPNFISYKNMTRRDVSVMSKWWHFLAKQNLGTLISLDILGKIGCQLLVEKKQSSQNVIATLSQYKSTLDEVLSKRLRSKTIFSERIRTSLARVAIVVPVFNAIDDVKRCLASVLTSSYDNFSLIIADDASHISTQEWLEDFSKKNDRVVLMKSNENQGYTVNINKAIRHCEDYDFIILLNSDTVVCGDWIQKLLQRFSDDRYVGTAGPLSNKAGWQSFPLLRGENQIPEGMTLERINRLLEDSNHNSICPEVDIVNGFCICISKAVFDEIGYFDEASFPLGYGEEDDFCMRARLAGFKNVITLDTYVFHSKSKSMGHANRLRLATKGRTILDKRYQKSYYKELTESIGSNAIINVARSDFGSYLSPFTEETSIIGEKVINIESGFSFTPSSQYSILVHVHCYYENMCPYLAHYLSQIPFGHDLVITTSTAIEDDFFFQHFKSSSTGSVRVIRVENRGRDVYPFYLTLLDVDAVEAYDFVLHIHTKKSTHDPVLGVTWLSHLLSELLHSSHYISNLLSLMLSEGIGLAFPEVLDKHFRSYRWGKNKDIAIGLAREAGIDTRNLDCPFSFPAGFMFWVRPKYLRTFSSLSLSLSSFPPEPISIDGTMAHALERMITHFVEAEGGKVSPIKPKDSLPFENELAFFSSNLLSIQTVEDMITNAILQKEPFALIRYYDGEGAFFKASTWTEDYLNERMGYYFGSSKYKLDDAMAIRDSILLSIESADIVGIPNPEIVRRMIAFAELYSPGRLDELPNLKRRVDNRIDCTSAWRIISAFQLACNSLSQNACYVTKDVHYDLVRSGGIYRIIDNAEDVRLITSQPVAPLIERIFGKNVICYNIPPRAFDVDSHANSSHYPDHYLMMRMKLQSTDFSGSLVLVGAGPLGKEYCSIIKDRGGIAIDIGAVFDSWINFMTRPEHANVTGQIAGDLLLTSENVKQLTRMSVAPRSNISIEHLPKHKKNPHIEKRLS